jgi:VIT1/CCC1 family predicted Fe2+/Mn2+ transporter
MEDLDSKTRDILLTSQKNEITEHFIYSKLSQSARDEQNNEILKQISNDEMEHYHFWKEYTNKDVNPNRLKIWRYYLISRILGITFGIKLMERGEKKAQVIYEKISEQIPSAKKIIYDEDIHEQKLVNMINEERLKYISSIVLGLNDALVELTGALAGFTLALQNTNLIGITGLITGIAASLSMGASEYLSTKSEESEKSPAKAAIYTSIAYVLTVFLLIFPYLILTNVYLCLGLAIIDAIVVILIFTFYVSVAKEIEFKKRFLEMALISLGIAALSFVIGYLVNTIFNVTI